MYIDIHKYIRKVNIKKYFLTNNNCGNKSTKYSEVIGVDSGLKNKSLFNPPQPSNHHVEVFKQLILKDLEALQVKKSLNPKHIKEGVQALEKRKDVVVRPADKGGGVVVLDKSYYHSQLQEMLNDGNTYSLLSGDPNKQYRTELRNLVDYGYYMRIINKKEKQFLCPSFNRTPTIYTVPKMHKHLTLPPGRPIVNGIESVTARVGQYLDHFLQGSVITTKAYLKDTTDFLQKLKAVTFLTDSTLFLVTADVSSLYTNIHHEDAILALNWALSKREELPHMQKKFLKMVLEFCLTHNYFWYGGHFYNQKTGVAMGAKFAPSLANLFMSEWEDKWIFHNKPRELIFYQRYIDDLFIIWEGSEETLKDYANKLNTNGNNIKLEFQWDREQIHYLDVTVMKGATNFYTKAYFKPSDRNSYIPIQSGHHPRWLRNIPKGQFMRIRRNCTEDTDYYDQASLIKQRFVEKGYKESSLNHIMQEVGNTTQNNLLEPRTRPPNKQHEWGFITGYHEQYKDVEAIFRKHWNILKLDKVLNEQLPSVPPFIYRKAPSFGDQIVKKVLDPPKKLQMFWDRPGFTACRRCKACRQVTVHLRDLKHFTSTANGTTFEIKECITCASTHVIYALECPCGLMYIGRTKRKLSKRVSEHIYNITIGYEEHSVSLHFLKKHNKNPLGLKFWGVDKIDSNWRGSNRVREISKRETEWIFRANTLSPNGLNIDLDLNCFISNH